MPASILAENGLFWVPKAPGRREFHPGCVEMTPNRLEWFWRGTPRKQRNRGDSAQATELEGALSRRLVHQNHPKVAFLYRCCNASLFHNAFKMRRTAPHPVPLPIRWGEGVRRTGEG
jgi:hypothetical protein